MTVRQMLRGLLKFLAVAVGAGALGVGVGVGLAEVGGSDATTPALETTSGPAETDAATSTAATPATQTQTTAAAPGLARTPHVQVLSALLCPSTEASVQARRQARLTIRVRVTNRDAGTLAAQAPRLLVGAARIASDPAGKDAAGALLEALEPAASATGTLRFQTSGSVTQRLSGQHRARLGIAGRIVAVPVATGSTPATCG